MASAESRAVGGRLRRVREALGVARPEWAERLGVHPGSIARWETGGSVPQHFHLDLIAGLADATVGWLRDGEGAPPALLGVSVSGGGSGGGSREGGGAGERYAAGREAQDLFGSFDAVVRFLGGIAPRGRERLRKLDALEGLRRMLTARGHLPSWWYELRDRVENDQV